MGMEIKSEMKDCDQTKNENLKLKQQIKSLEKILKEKEKSAGIPLDEEWETTSENSIKSINISKDSVDVSSTNSKGSVEKLLIQALQSLGTDKTKMNTNKNPGEKISTKNQNNEPRETNPNNQDTESRKSKNASGSRVDSGPPTKVVCKYKIGASSLIDVTIFTQKDTLLKKVISPLGIIML